MPSDTLLFSQSSSTGRMLTVKEAGERLRVSSSLVYQLCARGVLEHHRCGLGRGTIRIEEKALEAYLERSKVIAKSPLKGANDRSTFKCLDVDRLRESWKRQGVG